MSGRGFWIVAALIGGGLILLIVNDSSGQTFGLPNSAFATTLYLGIWAGVLAVGILGSRQRLGDVARNLALWLLIALVLVAGYQYRYELQDVLSRVTAGLVPGSPLSVGDGNGGTVVMIDKSPNGHFEARAGVNETTITFMIDTGASSTVLTEADARRAGYDPAALSYAVPISTANGTATAAHVTADRIAVGAIERRNVPMLVVQPGMLDQSLLGMNFIGTLSGFDVRGDRLILRD
ncbi:MAG: TIGR02281 family clan AA aspartic protease [Rhizobiaceae bacterium]|nr:TIGR02281 family clan AA aspartic protease [Rhizobiaceae bacterium]